MAEMREGEKHLFENLVRAICAVANGWENLDRIWLPTNNYPAIIEDAQARLKWRSFKKYFDVRLK